MTAFSPAAQRNTDPLIHALRPWLSPGSRVLEVASGTGQHAAALSAALSVAWQPSDRTGEHFVSIASYAAQEDTADVPPAVVLDVTGPWPAVACDAVFCANMIHIAPWAACVSLFQGAAAVLAAGGHLITYGPYRFPETPLAPSNVAFDASLRARDPAWGIRDLTALEEVAEAAGLELSGTVEMPANNHLLRFVRG